MEHYELIFERIFLLMNYYLITPAKKKLSTHNYKGDGFVEIRGGILLAKHTSEIPKIIGVLHVHGYIRTTWEDLSSRIGKDRFGASHF